MDPASRDVADVAKYFAVLAESMPCPVIQFGEEGRVLIANARAARLLSRFTESGEPRVLLADGKELWSDIAAEAYRGASLVSGSARVVLSDGGSATIWYAGFPAAVRKGKLSGAVVMVYDASEEDILGPRSLMVSGSGSAAFERIALGLAEAVAADAVFVTEIEPDRPRSGSTLAAVLGGELRPGMEWDLAPSPAPSSAGKPITVIRDDLAARFGDDPLVAAHGFRAFAGSLLFDETGERAGVIGAYFTRPIEDVPPLRGIIRLFSMMAGQAAAALKADRALLESEKRAASLFAHGHMPILLIEPSSTQIVEANPAACSLYGVAEGELVTMSVLQFAAEAPEALRAELRSAADGSRDYFITKQLAAGGEVREIEVFAGPLVVGGRTLVYAVLHDVTEKRKAEARLASYRRELEMVVQRRTSDLLDATTAIEAERERRAQLYRDMGLELRTPLQTILGFSEALATGLAGELNSEQAKQVLMIGEAAKRLSALVDDILELARLEAGAAEDLRIEPFDARHLAESVAVGAEAQAAEKGLAVRVESPDSPVDVETDRTRLEQILAELVSNAVKYTSQGSIVVRVFPSTGGEVKMQVADTGVGIPEHELPHIFEEFRHLRTDAAGKHVGTGLGLALCKRLTEAIGGRIDVESTPGAGTTFTIRFPAYLSSAEAGQ